MRNRKFLIFGFIVIFAVAGVCLWSAFKMKDNIGLICRKDTYSLVSYMYGYNPKEEKQYMFISEAKDLDKLIGILGSTDINTLDIKNYDYLIYFQDPQHGCDRTYRLECVEYDKKGINLDINSYEVEPKCDIIFSDSFIIELEKGKYNQDIEVKIKD